MDINTILQQCTVDGLVVKLPDIKLDRKEYLQVAKKLELIGGKWKGGKVMGFVFQKDPTELLAKISLGDVVNIQKQYQFFATPSNVADILIGYVNRPFKNVCEPSAGQGALVDALLRKHPNVIVDCYELMDINRDILSKHKAVNLLGDDFLLADTSTKYDLIIANPPFSKNQDIKHIRKMYDILSDVGELITISSKHYEHCNNKEETSFREFLEDVNAIIIPLEAGLFKESGTSISTNLIVIRK